MKPYIIIIILSLLAAGCAFNPDDRLVGLYDLCDSSPQAVLDSLTRIDRASLGEADRHYFDFLSVKATDKAYLPHSSDSLILSVVDYASNHQSHGYYPEALYYCGRVYSDQGDYPTALTYFHQALNTEAEDNNDKVQTAILSQTARLLFSLRLYDESIPILERVTDLEQQRNDTLNLVYNLQLLGSVLTENKEYALAKATLTKALILSKDLPSEITAATKMQLSDLKYQQGEIDSAMILLRGLRESVDPADVNAILASYARLYYKAGVFDSSYIYASELIKSHSPNYKEIGYNRILTRALRPYLHADTAFKYLYEYVGLLENYYNNNQNKMVIAQQAMYNYKSHDIARVKAEKSQKRTLSFLTLSLIAILFITILLLYFKNKSQKYEIKLHLAYEKIDNLELQLDENIKEKTNIEFETFRKRLRSILLNSDGSEQNYGPLDDSISNSPVYKILKSYIANEKSIPEKSELWEQLQELVFLGFPNFKINIEKLTERKLTQTDLRTIALIRCRFSPTEMSVLCQRERSSINSRRKEISRKLFGTVIDLTRLDKLIWYL